jgi:selenocysteine lyase/cysteine desulfurase
MVRGLDLGAPFFPDDGEALAGFAATIDYLSSIGGMTAIASWEAELAERFLAGLPSGTTVYGPRVVKGRIPVFLLNLPGIGAASAAGLLASRGMGVWSGTNFYALGLYERLNWGEALRVGLAHCNTLQEVDALTDALRTLVS